MTKPVRNLQTWFKTHVEDSGHPYTLDSYQAAIVLDSHKNTIVTARAGSGKTRTIVAKVAYLIGHEKIPPEKIIIFAFNKKACLEVNERLTKITIDKKPLFTKLPKIATTFHAFAYRTLKIRRSQIVSEELTFDFISKNLSKHYRIIRPNEPLENIPEHDSREPITAEEFSRHARNLKQFIDRAEQQFFSNYDALREKIDHELNPSRKDFLKLAFETLEFYHAHLTANNLINFSQMVAKAAKNLPAKTPYKYIFIDEYQDFSLLFLTMIKSLRKTCETAHLLAVGDDWQAINRFAGSDVEYFKNFESYFPENHKRLFIPTNYRSGRKIVENANFFMSKALKDYQGCKSGNRLKSKIFLLETGNLSPAPTSPKYPLGIRQYLSAAETVAKHLSKSAKSDRNSDHISLKLLARNNDLGYKNWSLFRFENTFSRLLSDQGIKNLDLSCSTIHKSKGLEADAVILLGIDAGKFPAPDKSGGLWHIFGSNDQTLLEDEFRLFYVALTRPKKRLYIFTKSLNEKLPKKLRRYDFLKYLNENWLNPL